MAGHARRALQGLLAAALVAVQPLLLVGALAATPPGPLPAADGDLFDAWRQPPRLSPSAGFAAPLEEEEGAGVEAIAQFRGKVTQGDVDLVVSMGLEVLRSYTVVPALHVRGPAAALGGLLNYDRLYYLEPNRQALFDQEISTTVINASLVWETEVLGAQNFPSGIDGTGVTFVIVDTGIDAGHPDLDYGSKVIMNLQETVPGVWTGFENTDTNYGHGTHVAGTVAGNGEASAGARRGVAPGANLIGLTVTVADTAGYLSALNWVYDHSRPGQNPYNIRGATNSWHTTVGEYDPASALSQAVEALAFENNVVTTWSAGNDGRTDPTGETITTSQQGNTPVAVMVAAYEHNGSAVTDFSSRGQVGLSHTYPDIGAPGRTIWSTSARRTLISSGTYTGGNTNPYYLAISGTSMSTPHTAGAVALLFQAAPSLRISQRHEDYNGTDPEGWAANPLTRIHEVEWILQATALYLPPDANHGNPANHTEPGMDGQAHDYVQGYGIIDVHAAVALALSLEKLRRDNPGREVSVADAIAEQAGVRYSRFEASATDRLSAHWSGEYGRFTDMLFNVLATANQTKFVYIPPGATTLEIVLNYDSVDVDRRTVGDLTWAVDWNSDGTNDVTGSLAPAAPGGHKEGSVAVPSERAGQQVAINVIGQGLRLQQPLRDHVYAEWRAHYTLGVTAVLSLPVGDAQVEVDKGNYSSMLAPWAFVPAGEAFAGGNLTMNRSFIDIREVALPPAAGRQPTSGVPPFAAALAALVLGAVAVGIVAVRRPAVRDRLRALPGVAKVRSAIGGAVRARPGVPLALRRAIRFPGAGRR